MGTGNMTLIDRSYVGIPERRLTMEGELDAARARSRELELALCAANLEVGDLRDAMKKGIRSVKYLTTPLGDQKPHEFVLHAFPKV